MTASSAGEHGTVLLIDDDPVVHGLVEKVLSGWGYEVIAAADGTEGLRRLYSSHPDLVLLDVGLPDIDGWQVLSRIRELGEVPVLMLTAEDREADKVRALRAGADDYLTKPFGSQELPARVEAAMRRASGSGSGSDDAVYADGRLTVDHEQRLVTVVGRELRLTPLEFRLLSAFVRHPGQILSHEQLIELAWREPYVQQEQVKLYVGRLRRKLGDPEAIETLRGFGYRYLPPPG